MESKQQLYWAFGILGTVREGLEQMNPLDKTNPNFGYGFSCYLFYSSGILFALALVIDYFTKTNVIKEYAKFIYYMEREAKRIKLSVMPEWSERYLFVRRSLQKFPLIGFVFNFGPLPKSKLEKAKNKYLKWREVMAEALDFIFEKPEKGLPVSILFRGDISRSDWGRELLHNLMAFDKFLTSNPLIETSCSKRFTDDPQKLHQFRKKYLAIEKRKKERHWTKVK